MSALSPGEEWLETDAAVNAVNSGGPLINLSGEVVGINTALAGRRGPIAGMGFAFPADRARRVAADLIAFGRVRRAFLGVQIEPVGTAYAERPGGPAPLAISIVTPGTPAAEAGLRAGDVLVSVGGRPIDSVGMIQESIETAAVGEDLALTIERGGRRQDVIVRPRARPVGAVLPGVGGPRPMPETRRDALKGQVRSRIVPGGPAPRPAPAMGEDAPLSLEPIPRPPRPGDPPVLEPSQGQPLKNPR